jgi:molybdopterin/thiamine biosynthesis adenylyltransferase
MNDVTLAIPEAIESEFREALAMEVESAAVLLCGCTDDGERLTLTANHLAWVPEKHYGLRKKDQLVIGSAGWVPALKIAAEEKWVPVFLHTHPGMTALPSEKDGAVDRQLAESFRVRSRSDYYASVVVGGKPDRPEFTGRVLPASGKVRSVRRVRVVGRRIRLTLAADQEPGKPPLDAFDRQVRVFGTDGQRLLRELRVGVVGAGGTGSAVIEQLGRLGIGALVLIDDDEVDDTNLTRIHESSAVDVGKPKVEVLADAVRAFGFGTDVETYTGRINSPEGFHPLRSCDLVFGCTDDEHGRIVLCRIAYWHLAPVIDMGVRLRAQEETLQGIDGRVTYLAPGEACLLCRKRIDLQRAREEVIDPAEREQLIDEGYAQGLDDPDPAVVTYTTLVASWAVADLLERLFGFGDPDVAAEHLLRIHDRKTSRIGAEARDYHFCGDRAKWGRGDRDPALDYTWN